MVEVLVPLFNGRAGLSATLRALAGQSCANWTLSVRDDGSQDEGPDLVRAFASAIPEQRVRLTGGAHRGLARSVMTLLAGAEPRASAAAIAVPGCRFGSGTLAEVQAVLEASAGPALILVRPAWRDGRPEMLDFAESLAGRVPAAALVAVNRAALDLLRIASLWRGPVPCAAVWACRLVAGAGGEVTVLPRRGGRAASRGLRGGVSAPGLEALRAAGPLLTPASRRLIEQAAAALEPRPRAVPVLRPS